LNGTDGLLLAAPLGLMVRSPKEKAVTLRDVTIGYSKRPGHRVS
jgi:hypothetical protein